MANMFQTYWNITKLNKFVKKQKLLFLFFDEIPVKEIKEHDNN